MKSAHVGLAAFEVRAGQAARTLLRNQGYDGGWGLTLTSVSSVVNTSEVLPILRIAGIAGQPVRQAFDFLVVTDAASACPIYTVETPGGTVWGSSARALSSLVGSRVDAEWLALYLLDRQAPQAGRSAWADVVPVPPGHRLTLGSDGATSVSSWWTPNSRSYEEALPLVYRSLTEGVKSRVESVASSTDLAGMDSTTLAVIAARCGPITGMTVHPEGITEGGDMTYARTLTSRGLNRIEFPLRADHLPFTPDQVQLPATDEPAPSAIVWAMLSAQLRVARQMGSVCHLTGDGGDNLFLAPPTHLADLARRGHLIRVAAEAQAWARLCKISPWPVVGSALRGDAPRLARPWFARPAWVVSPVARIAETGRDADAVLAADVRGAARLAYADIQLADSLDIELHNPYFDGTLLDAVISVPSWKRFSVRRYKPMLVDAVGGLLPKAHRRRATKGVFAADFHQGVRANLTRVLALTDARLAGMGLIAPGPLRNAVHGVALGADTVWPSLLTVLGVEMWLEAVESSPTTHWGLAKEALR